MTDINDLSRIDENLTELLTNTVDMAAVFYDIFLNPQPMDVNLQMYDDNNQLVTVTVPNRAKDRVIPYTGEGSPEGVVEAPVGATYVDTATSTVYYKVSGSDKYGWNAVISQSLMETYIRTYLEAHGYLTTSYLNNYLVDHEYVDITGLSTYLNENGYIRSSDLEDIPSLALSNKVMVITDDSEDPLKDITFGNFIASTISSDTNNALTRGSDSKLVVKIGDGITIESDGSASIKPATSNAIGGVKIGDGLSIESDGTLSVPAVSLRNIGEIVASTVPLTDAGLHLADGALISGSGSYSEFVDYIAGLYDSGDYMAIFDTEANWQSSVTTYGVCGKYVYDSVNNTVRLPKIEGFIEGGTTSTVGDLVQAGLPNVYAEIVPRTVNTGNSPGTIGGASGMANLTVRGYGTQIATMEIASNSRNADLLIIDASSNSDIYGNGTTVQPQSVKVLYYVVVATTTKTNIEVDIDEVATDLNGKADRDLTNTIGVISNSANIYFGGLAMPSNTYIDLTLPASDTSMVAPADGYVNFSKRASSSGQYIYLGSFDTSDNELVEYNCLAPANTTLMHVSLPVRKGQTFIVGYTAGGTLDVFRFVYAKGSESEAI